MYIPVSARICDEIGASGHIPVKQLALPAALFNFRILGSPVALFSLSGASKTLRPSLSMGLISRAKPPDWKHKYDCMLMYDIINAVFSLVSDDDGNSSSLGCGGCSDMSGSIFSRRGRKEPLLL